MSLCAKLSDTILAGNKADDTRPNFADLGQLLTHVGGLVEASNALSKSPEWQNLDRSDPDFFVKNSIMGVPQGYDAELDNLNERISDLEVRHMDRIRLEMFGPSSRVKIVRHQRQGWILEISKRHMTEEKECIDGLVASEEALRELEGTSQIKRFSSRRLDALDTEFRSLERELADRQKRIFVRLCDVACDHTHSIIQSARALSSLDVASSLAVVADEHGFCRPEVTTGTEFEVVGGYHAAVQKANLRHHASFVANDCHLSQQKMWLITGPNMGGKSTFLRQNALMIIMAQAGSFVPARSATIGVCDQLFARVGASDDISRHMSTFMVEMMETARILQKATHRSFVVLDEIGRGTSTYDGMAIASAVFEHLHDHTACRTLAATHYKEVARVAGQLRNAACHRTVFSHDGGDIVYGYNLEPGVAKRSHGIDVARISGMPKCVTDRAHHLLVALEATGDDLESSLGNTIAKSKK
ncbi:hypothetical protein SARC_03122 [Sphaeroforma arctica JP610]|uniref:DNA mismatch repair proteins mutS family domain-containing protein n=1 Tax=Sphaeroforma arctica JP610 TaxID=667725 RepID=A0A0L0G719_9EUKA|nr:hypothetical protein SARC_03122 [Sphaeroforma arctica JP610]KNC84661.1 hypothetical protein SARC_03122 [Sphaeroforma arctica JP610]|eukprot:XP_014158563.1 hypothetical protein SARC_03122 [Sphaeroforma arctica JP610]